MSLQCYQLSGDEMLLSMEQPASTQPMLDRIQEICEQDLSYYTPDIVNLAKSNRYYGVLFELLCEKKQQMALPADDRRSRPEHHAQVQRIDNMLKECMGYADASMDECDDEERSEQDQTDERYHKLLNQARTDFAQFMQHLQAKSSERSQEVVNILERQRYFRPITQADIERCCREIEMKFTYYQNQLKQLTCQNVMMLRSKYLDARRKRRNFSKEATHILSEFFYSHIDHPYPSEDAKVELARRCNITVNQVSNWFGNKRIRSKKSQGRQMDGPAVECGDGFDDGGLRCGSEKQEGSSNSSLQQHDYQQLSSGDQQYFGYSSDDQHNILQSVEAIASAYMSY